MFLPARLASRAPIVLLLSGLTLACAGVAIPVLMLADTFSVIADPTEDVQAKQRALDDGLVVRAIPRVAVPAGIALVVAGAALLIARRKRSSEADNDRPT